MKFKYVKKFEGGGQTKQIEASFGLPEVNIYPQNEFGNIARSQGINRARNWKKVKEGTTKGINDFYNDPRTQMVMAGLPLPSMLDAAGDAIKVVGPIIKNSKIGKNTAEVFGNIKGNVKKYINKNIVNNLTEHVQGDEAIKMFKEYGGTKPSIENSPLMHRMQRYVPEARERYGIVGNTNITDDEIAKSLYKQVNQISQPGNKAVNSKGEPLVLFRGDTKRYENLRPPSSPEEVAKETWTMDNALGTLYLGDLPNPKGEGLDRYLVTQRFGGIEGLNSSATGSKYVVPKGIDRSMPLPGSRLLTQRNAPHGASDYIFKVPSKYVESGVNDINAFVVNSKGIRDATDEISVFFDDALSKKQSFKGITNNGSRESIAKHYQNVLDDANIKNQGLLKSNKRSQLRDEHDYYDYYALPKFNHNNIKHILPYDMRIPRDFSNPNIFASENLFASKKPANIKEAIDISLKGSRSAKEFVNSDAVKNSAKRNIDLYNRINKTNIIPKDYQAQPGLTSKFVDNFDDYINTNSPTGNTSNIGGLYDKVNNQVVLNKTSVSEPISFHENLHALGYGDRPYNQMKNKYIFDQKKIQGLSETAKNYYIKGNEPSVHYAQLGKTWGVNPGDPYPGRQTVENMIGQNGLSGAPVYTKLDTNRDYRRFWDAISGKYFSIAPIPIIGTQLNNKDKNK